MINFEFSLKEKLPDTERTELYERCFGLAESLEGLTFKFPGVQPHANEKNNNEESELSEVEREMIEMSGEPNYQELVDSLASEGVKIVVQGKSLFVTPAVTGRGVLAVAALNVESYMDGDLAELIVSSQKLRK